MARYLLLLIASICIGSSYSFEIFGGPLHASCKIEWNIGHSCERTVDKIKSQIATWGEDFDCKQGEKCLYKLVSSDGKTLKATHETPAEHYVDDLTFTFTPSGSQCQVHGFSTSETWYAVLDYGTNYCNLHNLITGSGLDKTDGYEENVSSSECTQVSTANCDKY